MFNLVLLILLLVSAIHLTFIEHKNRYLVDRLNDLKKEANQLEIQYGQLQLEQSTYAAHSLIEEKAEQQLDMTLPEPKQIKTVVIKALP